MRTRKPVLILDTNEPCPHCNELIHLHIERVVKTPGVAAQTELVTSISKATQTQL